ncbi:putative secreted RxLR effector peptide protein [Phytophthora cinnamomi]|uniref:putative secreted RxLR effector peptide protein n=1 Tax=Phytophthora cinnamomi TaxID=4785 RepID=UPI003559CDD0|nr:putative secreted RxLR effector peptide protein [Phytophthora cinnamomi]
MRIAFYVAMGIAVFARNSVVAVFTNTDESKLVWKTSPDLAINAMISSGTRKRMLRVTDPEESDMTAPNEERVQKYASLAEIIKKLDDEKAVTDILKDMTAIHLKIGLQAARKREEMTREEFNAAMKLLGLSK